MPVIMTRGIQVPLPLPGASAPSLPRRQGRPERRRYRRVTPRHCPDCRGPMATGEGFTTCVVCGLRRAA